MIRIKLPVLEQEFVDDKIVSSRSEIDCYIDMSALAQERWEREYPNQAKNEALFDYVTRLDKEPKSPSKVISMLKVLYCFIQFDKYKSKDEWLSMFSLSDAQYLTELTDKLSKVFKAIYPDDRKNF